MTNEKILETLVKIEYEVNNNGSAVKICIEKAIEEVKEDMRKDLQKKKGCAKRDKLIQSMMKSVPDVKPILKYYQKVGEQFGFTDAYRAYILNDNFGYDGAENHLDEGTPFNLSTCFPKAVPPIELKINLQELQLYIKQQKAEAKATKQKYLAAYIIENDKIKIGFNPQFLLEFCQMFDTESIFVSSPKSLAYCENEAGEKGILLPVRIIDK